MDGFRVLVIIELRYYREVISSAVRMFRPNIEVISREPELCDDEGLISFKPDLVICTSATPPIRAHCFAWVELYPRGEPVAVACIDGHPSTINEPELDDFVTIIDRVENEKAVRVGGGLLLGDA
jgi:hypothetical protein